MKKYSRQPAPPIGAESASCVSTTRIPIEAVLLSRHTSRGGREPFAAAPARFRRNPLSLQGPEGMLEKMILTLSENQRIAPVFRNFFRPRIFGADCLFA